MNKATLRQIVLGVMAADFPMLYLGAVTFESAVVSISALVIMGVAAAVVAVVY